MATKFVDLEAAAEELGISVEKLTEMREKNEIRGFRDGATWKFKAEDLAQVKASLDAGGSELDLDEADGDKAELQIADSILLSEVELGGAESVGSSTVIGQTAGEEQFGDDVRATVDASDVQPVSDSLILDGGKAEPPSSDVLGSDSVDTPEDAGSEIQLAGGDEPDLEFDLSDSTAGSGNESNLALGDSNLSLEDDSKEDDHTPSSGDSEIDMTDEEEGVLVLGGTGSDVVGASDSGISLGDPADSGISLEGNDPDLGSSAIGDDSLLLGEENSLSAEGSSPSQLQQDDDFLLTPLEDAMSEDSESSSQVIALDEADAGFNASSDTLMESGDADLAMLDPEAGTEGGAAALIQPAPQIVQQAIIPEMPYSVWNVLSLFLCIALLALSGMLVYDLVRQIWSWEGVHPVNSGLMDAIIGMFRN